MHRPSAEVAAPTLSLPQFEHPHSAELQSKRLSEHSRPCEPIAVQPEIDFPPSFVSLRPKRSQTEYPTILPFPDRLRESSVRKETWIPPSRVAPLPTCPRISMIFFPVQRYSAPHQSLRVGWPWHVPKTFRQLSRSPSYQTSLFKVYHVLFHRIGLNDRGIGIIDGYQARDWPPPISDEYLLAGLHIPQIRAQRSLQFSNARSQHSSLLPHQPPGTDQAFRSLCPSAALPCNPPFSAVRRSPLNTAVRGSPLSTAVKSGTPH